MSCGCYKFNSKDQAGELSSPIKIDWEGKGNHEIFAFHQDGYWERLHSEQLPANLKNRWESSFVVPFFVRVSNSWEERKPVSLGKSGFQVISANNSQKAFNAGRIKLSYEYSQDSSQWY